MTNFNAEHYSTDIAKRFFAVLNLQPMKDAVVNSSNIADSRDEIYGWYQYLQETFQDLTASNIKDIYWALKSKISSGEIGIVHIVFFTDDENEPVQDKHPLLRTVDFVAHLKRSVQAYSRKAIDWTPLETHSKRFKELGDHYDPLNIRPLITHLFLDVEDDDLYHSIGYKNPAIEDALNNAIKYEKDVEQFAINPTELVSRPAILKERLALLLPPYTDIRQADVPALMKWEALADKALGELTLPEIQSVYQYYRDLLKQDGHSITENGALSVIISEIQSVCRTNERLKPYLQFAPLINPPPCDNRVSHLLGASGRYVANLEDALNQAIAAQKLSNQNNDLSRGPSNT